MSEGRVRRDELDGVPVFWGDEPGRAMAALVFRAGRCDETLPNGGLTHLLEHLALPADRLRSVDFNGQVDGIETVFFATGARESVLELLSGTASRLASPPMERLDVERGILLTEAAGTGTNPVRTVSALRYGPVGHGLVGYDEYGLYGADPEAVAAWVARCFTRENAALWIHGELPDELPLDLPRGERLVPPPPRPIPYLTFPCAYDGGQPGTVAASLVAPRSHALSVAMSVAEHRLLRTLRYEEGISYSVDWWYSPMTADVGHTVISADTLEGNADRVRTHFLATLEELAEHGPSEEELEFDAEDLRRHWEDPDSLNGALAYAASTELFGLPFEPEAKLHADRRAVTPAAAAEALREALESLFLLVPYGCGIGSLSPYPYVSPSVVEGHRTRPRGRRRRGLPTLVTGTEGISHVEPDGSARTVRFDECVALLHWSDGTRGVWSSDGFYIEVDPAQWRGGDEVARELDAAVPAKLRVAMDREASEHRFQVQEAVEGAVKRNWQTKDELDVLADVLDHNERIDVVAAASQGLLRAGLLVLTERRLLFLFLGEVKVELARDALTSARRAPGGLMRDNKLVVAADGAEHVFTDISPDERVDELVAALSRTSAAPA